MKVLVITNMYPSSEMPYYGIFVAEQVQALRTYHPDLEFDIYNICGNSHKTSYLKSITEVYKKIKCCRFDLIHIHYGFSGLFLLNPFLKIDIPIILTLHGGDILPEQGKSFQVFCTRRIIKKVTAAITLNERMDSIAKKLCPNTSIIPCSVDTSCFVPSTTNKKTKNFPTIIFPSSPTRQVKNYPLFKETIELLSKEYQTTCREVALENMSREEISSVMQEADLMLMTSISEGSPQVVKEAMACNLPVVSTNVGDVQTLLEGVEGSGWTDEHSPISLAKLAHASLNGLIKGKKPREKVLELGLDAKSTADKIYQLYCDCLNYKC